MQNDATSDTCVACASTRTGTKPPSEKTPVASSQVSSELPLKLSVSLPVSQRTSTPTGAEGGGFKLGGPSLQLFSQTSSDSKTSGEGFQLPGFSLGSMGKDGSLSFRTDATYSLPKQFTPTLPSMEDEQETKEDTPTSDDVSSTHKDVIQEDTPGHESDGQQETFHRSGLQQDSLVCEEDSQQEPSAQESFLENGSQQEDKLAHWVHTHSCGLH